MAGYRVSVKISVDAGEAQSHVSCSRSCLPKPKEPKRAPSHVTFMLNFAERKSAVAWVETNDRGQGLAGMLTGGIFDLKNTGRVHEERKNSFSGRIVGKPHM